MRLLGIDLALHHVIFAIDRGQSLLGLYQDHAVHAVGDMLGDHRRRAMIDVEAGIEGAEGEALALAGSRQSRDAAAARSGHRVEVDVVRHDAVGRIIEVDLDRVADTDSNERSGHAPVEGPVMISRAVGELTGHLDRLQADPDRLRTAALERPRQIGRVAGDIDDRRIRGRVRMLAGHGGRRIRGRIVILLGRDGRRRYSHGGGRGGEKKLTFHGVHFPV